MRQEGKIGAFCDFQVYIEERRRQERLAAQAPRTYVPGLYSLCEMPSHANSAA